MASYPSSSFYRSTSSPSRRFRVRPRHHGAHGQTDNDLHVRRSTESPSGQGYMPGMGLEQLSNCLSYDADDSDRDGERGDFEFEFNQPHTSVPRTNPTLPHREARDDQTQVMPRNINSTLPFQEGSPRLTNSRVNDLFVMMQNQQALLQKVLKGQETLQERQDEMETSLASLQNQVSHAQPDTPPSSSSSSEGKRKRIVTRSLSVGGAVAA